MMTPSEFLRTLYLGDRGCKGILIDSWKERVLLQVTAISRIRSPSGNWEYYTDEDIIDGFVVFSGVEAIRFEPPGPVPNDYIASIDVEPIDIGTVAGDVEQAPSRYAFRISVGSCDASGDCRDVVIEIAAKGVHLEDPARPGLEIVD